MTLAALKTELDRQKAQAGKVVITSELVPPNLQSFWRGLPHAQLSVSVQQPFPWDEISGTLIVEGDATEEWFMRGIETGPFVLSHVNLRLVEAGNVITGELCVDGKLKIGNEDLQLSGSLT